MKTGFGRLAVMLLAFGAGTQVKAGVILTGTELNGTTPVHVGYDPASPTSNFATGPFPTNQATAYDVYINADANNVYFLFKADPSENVNGSMGRTGASYPDFANLYLSTTGTGTNIGVEVSQTQVTDAFVPGGQSGYPIPAGDSAVLFTPGTYNPTTGVGTGDSIEIGIAWSFFTTDPDNIGFQKLQPGRIFQLRDAQAFGYTYVAENLATTRLGQVTYEGVAATPEPATIVSMSLAAILSLGCAFRHRTARSSN